MTITVRQAGLSDVEALVILNRFVQDLHVAHQPDYFKQADAMLVADWFRCMLRNIAARVWIAELEGCSVGYALTITYDRPESAFCPARRFSEVDQIAVSAAFRKRGVARALVECVLEDARSRGICDVELSSWAFNLDAHDAFRALGFTEKSVRFGRKVSARKA
jgi:ribosomal protein S18 acetylase RimI-like enzyme